MHPHTYACQELGFLIHEQKRGAVVSGCARVMLEMPLERMHSDIYICV